MLYLTLSDIINYSTALMLVTIVVNIISLSNSTVRYYLTDNNIESTSSSVFVHSELHNPNQRHLLYGKLALSYFTGALAMIVFSSVVVGTIRGNIGDYTPDTFAHIALIWFSFQQVLRVVVEQYILRTVLNTKPKVVKIDGNKHYISKVNKLPWIVSHRYISGFFSLFLSTLFVYIF